MFGFEAIGHTIALLIKKQVKALCIPLDEEIQMEFSPLEYSRIGISYGTFFFILTTFCGHVEKSYFFCNDISEVYAFVHMRVHA